MGAGTITAIIVAVVVLGLLAFIVGAYNSFVKVRNLAEEAFSTMDVFMKKRYDLIPNLVETVKGYAAHESSTFENVMKARNMANQATTAEDKIANDNVLTGTLKSLFAVAEAYPDLKANQNFMALQDDLNKIEGEIADSRRYYNAVVRDYNTKLEVFPNNILAGIFNFKRKPMYEVSDAAERENVQVKF